MLSIIIPIYNAEKYLSQCLDSLLAQSLQDAEFILIIDGATDKSEEIALSYTLKDKRFKITITPNSGYGKACNTGITLALGDYITILEPDDYVNRPNYYQELYDLAKKTQIDFLFTGYTLFTDKKKPKPYSIFSFPKDGHIVLLELKENIHIQKAISHYALQKQESISLLSLNSYSFTQLLQIHTGPWAGLHKTKLLKEHNILFQNTPGASFQDIPFRYRIFSITTNILFIKENALYYRKHSEGSTAKNRNLFTLFDILEGEEAKQLLQRIPQKLQPTLFLYWQKFAILRIKRSSPSLKITNQQLARLSQIAIKQNWILPEKTSSYQKEFLSALKQRGNFRIYYYFWRARIDMAENLKASLFKPVLKITDILIKLMGQGL